MMMKEKGLEGRQDLRGRLPGSQATIGTCAYFVCKQLLTLSQMQNVESGQASKPPEN